MWDLAKEFMNFSGAFYENAQTKQTKRKSKMKTNQTKNLLGSHLVTRYWILWMWNSRQGVMFWDPSYISPSFNSQLGCPFLYHLGRIRDPHAYNTIALCSYTYYFSHTIWLDFYMADTHSDWTSYRTRTWLSPSLSFQCLTPGTWKELSHDFWTNRCFFLLQVLLRIVSSLHNKGQDCLPLPPALAGLWFPGVALSSSQLNLCIESTQLPWGLPVNLILTSNI